jgi:hypothetical protein
MFAFHFFPIKLFLLLFSSSQKICIHLILTAALSGPSSSTQCVAVVEEDDGPDRVAVRMDPVFWIAMLWKEKKKRRTTAKTTAYLVSVL